MEFVAIRENMNPGTISSRSTMWASRLATVFGLGASPTPTTELSQEHRIETMLCAGSMCGPKFCSMEITQQIREMADTSPYTETLAAEMRAKSPVFKAAGSTIYIDSPSR
jgi:hypothetical protein